MSKYIDADKLIALIDTKLEDLGLSGSVWVGRSVLQDLKNDIVTSLQQEQPEVDLWKEIHRYFNPHGMKLQFDRSKGNTILEPEQLIKFAHHFAEWGATHLNARKEE